MSWEKTKVRRAFAGAARQYDQFAALQRQIGLRLLTKIALPEHGGVILDLGCGTGFLTGQLLAQSRWRHCLAMDIAVPMLEQSRQNLNGQDVHWLCGDAEQLPLTEHCLDWLVSNLALQWCLDLPALFTGFKRVLKPGGQLAFTSFGPDTLHELKSAWRKVDAYKHVNDFASPEQVFDALSAAGFRQIEITTERLDWPYPSVMALMRELKAIGAHQVGIGRTPHLTTRRALQTMISQYESAMAEQAISACYQAIYVQARG